MIAGLSPPSTARKIERSPSIELVVELLVEGRTERSFRREEFLPDRAASQLYTVFTTPRAT